MSHQRFTAEQIIGKLREVEVLVAKGAQLSPTGARSDHAKLANRLRCVPPPGQLGIRKHFGTNITTGPLFAGSPIFPGPCATRDGCEQQEIAKKMMMPHTMRRRELTAAPTTALPAMVDLVDEEMRDEQPAWLMHLCPAAPLERCRSRNRRSKVDGNPLATKER